VERLPDAKQEIQFEVRTLRRKCRVRLDLNDPWSHLLGPTLPASQEVDELVDKHGVAELNVQNAAALLYERRQPGDGLLPLTVSTPGAASNWANEDQGHFRLAMRR
jgi:hypothetical protein